jgi:hypothetical protein
VTDATILQLANLFINSAQMMFLAYLAAKFHKNGGSSS